MGRQMMVDINKCYRISENVVAREIEGELIIVPLRNGVGNLDAEMFALNATGVDIWNKLDGKRTLDHIINLLSGKYDMPYDQIRGDILELFETLLEKGLVVEL